VGGAFDHSVDVPRVDLLAATHQLPAWRPLVARRVDCAPVLATLRLPLEPECLAVSMIRGRSFQLVDPSTTRRMLDERVADASRISRYLASYVLSIKIRDAGSRAV
jgi:hypothetical protein